jgi:hypothetical protein
MLDRLAASDVTLVEYKNTLTVVSNSFKASKAHAKVWGAGLNSRCSPNAERLLNATFALDVASDAEMPGEPYVAHGATYDRAFAGKTSNQRCRRRQTAYCSCRPS